MLPSLRNSKEDNISLDQKLSLAMAKAREWIRTKFPGTRVAPAWHEESEDGTYFNSAGPFEIFVPDDCIRDTSILFLARLLLHEQGHFVFAKGRLYKRKEFIEVFMQGSRRLVSKQKWEDSYPDRFLFLPKYWRRDYVDYLGAQGLAIKGYATQHLEDEFADMFAALCDPNFNIVIPKGLPGERLKKRLDCIDELVRSNKYLK